MGRRTRVRRSDREAVLEGVADDDPGRYERLLELRAHNPQAYRKAVRGLVRRGEAKPKPVDRFESLPVNREHRPTSPGAEARARLLAEIQAAKERFAEELDARTAREAFVAAAEERIAQAALDPARGASEGADPEAAVPAKKGRAKKG